MCADHYVCNPPLLDLRSDTVLQYCLIEYTRAGTHVSNPIGAKYFERSPPQQNDGQQAPFMCRAMSGEEGKFNVCPSTILRSFSFEGGLPIRGTHIGEMETRRPNIPSKSYALREKLGEWIALPMVQCLGWLEHSISLH